MSENKPTEREVVHYSIYRIPKVNHDAMLQICKKVVEMYKQHGVLRYQVSYQLYNTATAEVPTEKGVTAIAEVISANQDEEVWVESFYFRNRQHLNEVMSKMGKDS